MIARIRKGNDFHVAWKIKRGGVAENLENVTNIKLERTIYGITTEHTLFTVSGDTITAEIPAEVQTHYGQYKLTLSYELVDTGMSDDDRKCKVAIYAFAIVDPLGPADDLLTVDVASDVSIGFKGDKGLSAYQVWLEDGNVGTEDDYFAYLRQPATDAAESLSELEQTVSGNEALRVTAEQGRFDAELLRVGAESARNDAEGIRDANETARINAEGIRDANETDRINAESDRVDAEDLRNQAEVAREEAEGLRQTNTATAIQNAGLATTAANTAAGLANNAATAANTAAGDANNAAEAANTAAGLANNAATAANTAAGLADDARLAIQDDLALKADQADLVQLESDVKETTEKPTAQSLSELNARITALEAILSNKIKDRIDVTKEFNVWGKTNLILTGSGAATFAPDFVGQKYIDTTGGNVYVAVGVSNAGNWKLV
jgi:hypothetical protein